MYIYIYICIILVGPQVVQVPVPGANAAVEDQDVA